MVLNSKSFDIECNDGAELFSSIEKLMRDGKSWYFRGQPAIIKNKRTYCLPTLFRSNEEIKKDISCIAQLSGNSHFENNFSYFCESIQKLNESKVEKLKNVTTDKIKQHLIGLLKEYLFLNNFLILSNRNGLNINFEQNKLFVEPKLVFNESIDNAIRNIKLSGEDIEIIKTKFTNILNCLSSCDSLKNFSETRSNRNIISYVFSKYLEYFPFSPSPILLDEFLSVAPLARHHGVPSRLLDFTSSFQTAIYMSLTPIDKNIRKIAIYAINEELLNIPQGKFRLNLFDPAKFVNIYQHKNLFRQKGYFIRPDGLDAKFLECGRWLNLEEVISSEDFLSTVHQNFFLLEPNKDKAKKKIKSNFKRFVLSVDNEKSEQILSRLERQCEISLSYLMPSFDTVGASVKNMFS